MVISGSAFVLGHCEGVGIGGVKVDTQAAGTGSFTATYSIPAAFDGYDRLAIRLQSPTTGYYSYNWFNNVDLP